MKTSEQRLRELAEAAQDFLELLDVAVPRPYTIAELWRDARLKEKHRELNALVGYALADQPAATETGPRCPACRATFTEERMVEVGMRCPSCGTRFFRKPEAEAAPVPQYSYGADGSVVMLNHEEVVRASLAKAETGPRGAPPHSYAIGAGGGDDGCSACGAGQHEPCKSTCEVAR